jgi:hypothetical protein
MHNAVMMTTLSDARKCAIATQSEHCAVARPTRVVPSSLRLQRLMDANCAVSQMAKLLGDGARIVGVHYALICIGKRDAPWRAPQTPMNTASQFPSAAQVDNL